MMLVCNVALATYEIYRSNCRRYGVFKVHTRNKKLTTGLIVSTYAEFLALCARTCLRTFNCKAINYKPAISNNEPNCEILSSGSDTAETLLEVVGWNFYKPLTQNVSKQQHLIDLYSIMTIGCKKDDSASDSRN